MRARAVAGVLVVGLLLAGCSDDEPDPSPSLAPLTPTPSASATAGDVPADAQAATVEGAAEFVREFYAALERAYATRDPELIRPLVTQECGTCQRLIDAITRLRDENATVDGYTIEVVDVAAPAEAEPVTAVDATVILDVSEFVRRDASGQETTRNPPRENAAQDVALVRVDDGWKINSVSTS